MNTAIVLAAGQGKRMNAKVKKQYMALMGKPVVYYALKAFEDCENVHRIILVTAEEDEEYCRKEIIEKYQLYKVSDIVKGGAERYLSVYNGLRHESQADYILVHDGARPFITAEEINALLEKAKIHKACVAAVKSKDTVKISDEEGFVSATPARKNVWLVQTPQVFERNLLVTSYEKLIRENKSDVTDDATVVERYGNRRIFLVETSYENIKITTPEDLVIGENILKNREGKIRQKNVK